MTAIDHNDEALAHSYAAETGAQNESFLRKAARRLALSNLALREQLAQTPGDGDLQDANYQAIKVRDEELRELKSEFDAALADRDHFRMLNTELREERDSLKRDRDGTLADLNTAEDLAAHRRARIDTLVDHAENLREDLAMAEAAVMHLHREPATEEPSHACYDDLPF
jgi:hypothetical protein